MERIESQYSGCPLSNMADIKEFVPDDFRRWGINLSFHVSNLFFGCKKCTTFLHLPFSIYHPRDSRKQNELVQILGSNEKKNSC